jgi:hypothetical protein
MMSDERLDFRLRHVVGQGLNFCFYLLGRAQLRLPALTRPALWPAPDDDPFADFARRFEVADIGQLEPLHLEPLWRPWLQAVARTCPDSAADALAAMPHLRARPQARNTFQRFGRMQLNDFLERWTGIRLDLDGRLADALRTFDVARILARHQDALGVEYRPGRATFHYHLLRVFTVNRFGLSVVLGAAYLERPARLAGAVAHATLHALVEQTQVWEREEIKPLLQALGRSLRIGYLSPRDAAEEALCILADVIEHEGEAVPFDRIERRVGAPALRLLARAFYDTRRTRRSQGLAQWISAALQEAARARPGTVGL